MLRGAATPKPYTWAAAEWQAAKWQAPGAPDHCHQHIPGLIPPAVVLLVGMMIAVDFRVEDQIHQLSTATTRVETKLDDLLQRIPPVVAPAPRK